MPASYVDSTSATSASGTSMTVNTPTHSAGDRLVFLLANYDNSSVTHTAPTGSWTQIATEDTAYNSEQVKITVWTRIAGGSEPATLTATTSGDVYKEGACLSISGADSTTALDVAAAVGEGGPSPRTVAALTTTTDGCLLVLFSVGYNFGATSTPSGMTEREAWNGVNYLWTQAQAAAGSTGTKDHTQSSASSWITVFFAFRPSGAAAPASLVPQQGPRLAPSILAR